METGRPNFAARKEIILIFSLFCDDRLNGKDISRENLKLLDHLRGVSPDARITQSRQNIFHGVNMHSRGTKSQKLGNSSFCDFSGLFMVFSPKLAFQHASEGFSQISSKIKEILTICM